MKINDLMTAKVITCQPDDTLADAARKMWDNDVGCVPIVEPGTGIVLGIITDRDICMGAYLQGQVLTAIPVTRVMSRKVFTCHPDSEVDAVHTVMRCNQLHRIPVVDAEQRLVGIVSLNDLALHANALKDARRKAEQEEVATTLAEVCQHRLAVP